MQAKAANYRPDIDGLRALAVLAVVLFHLDSKILSGGFIGVDVFFVISGFLISGIILNLSDAGRFSFVDFYSRRIRRLFPTLLLVFGFSLVLGWFALFSSEFSNLGKEIFYGSLFSGNILFLQQAGYFDQLSKFKPLLHLWSLGVEEQFYLIWPILLVAFRGRTRVFAVVAVASVSLILNLALVGAHPDAAFYLPFTRLWELALGCICAFQMRSGALISQRFANTKSVAGLALILISAALFRHGDQFPGWRALVPTIGAYLIIAANARSWLNRNVLSHPWLVFIGLISYPLYLWHWPLLYFVRIMEAGGPSFLLQLGAVVLAFVFAWLSYRFLEIPIRTRSAFHTRFVHALVLASLAMLCLSYGAIRLGNPHPENHSFFYGSGFELTRKGCGIKQRPLWCLSDKREAPTNALIGDSHADALYPGLVRTSLPGGRWMFAGNPACPPLLGLDAACNKSGKGLIRTIASNPKIKFVLFAMASRILVDGSTPFLRNEEPTAFTPGQTFNALSQSVKLLQSAGKRVGFLIDNPAITDTPELCAQRILSLTRLSDNRCSISLDDFLSSTAGYRRFVQKLQTTFPNLLVYDPTNIYCSLGKCSVMNNGVSYYSYSDHISDTANEKVAKGLMHWLSGFEARPILTATSMQVHKEGTQ